MLAVYIACEHSNGDAVIPFVTFAYNTAAQTTSGFSPFFLLYRREQSCTMDTILLYRPDASECQPLSDVTRHDEECRQLARSFTTNDQGRQKQHHDKDHSSPSFRAGDLVWLRIPATTTCLASKLLAKYHGPYRILKCTSPVNYIVEPLTPSTDLRLRVSETVHVSRLKPYYDPAVLSSP